MHNDASMKLNREQKYAYTIILNRANNNKSGIFFVEGLRGIGKKNYFEQCLLMSD